jgi:ribosome-associated translation inhibitor RaiA
VNVTADAETVNQALAAAVDKLEKSLRKTIDKLDDKKGRISHAGEEV